MTEKKSRFRNRLLAALPERDANRIRREGELVTLKTRNTLYYPGEPIRHVYFIEDGVASLVSKMENGDVVEVGTVGHEGMVGLPVFLGASSTPIEAFAQISGAAWKLATKDFRAAVNHGDSHLSRVLQRYTQALFVQLSMSVACNRLHSVEQRCARWLLITADRVGRKSFPLTQEFLAQMLGVRRASANASLQNFRRKRLIEYRAGKIDIKNRRGLEACSCECYFVIRNEYQKLTNGA
jgi:CRP-like cAMP-binding protein